MAQQTNVASYPQKITVLANKQLVQVVGASPGPKGDVGPPGPEGPEGPNTTIGGLNDVSIGTIEDGDGLAWDQSSGLWVPVKILAETGGTIDGQVTVTSGGDANTALTTGHVVVGDPAGGSTLGIDNNEIQARTTASEAAGHAATLGFNYDGGDVVIGGAASLPDWHQKLHVRSNGSASIVVEADLDNVTETHVATINLEQDGGLVTAAFGINDDNEAYIDTSHASGGPKTKWVSQSGTVVAASGFSVTTSNMWRSGNQGWIYLVVELTGSPISVPASGNVVNTLVATLPTSMRGITNGISNGLISINTGRLASFNYDPDSGTMTLCAVGGSSDIATGESLSCSGMVLIDLV